MKILVDECLPRKLKHELPGHEVSTVPEMGWAGKKNGELLQLMNGQFDVFITIDGNMHYQQQLSEMHIAFVILKASNNKLDALKKLMPDVLVSIEDIQPGTVIYVKSE